MLIRRTVVINGQLVRVGKVLPVRAKEVREIPKVRLERPCCGGKIDRQVKTFREKQRRLRMEKL